MNVVIIGIDGLGRAVCNDKCPHITSFAKQSTVFNNAMTVFPPISAQAWGSLLLSVSPEKHGFTNSIVEKNPHDISSTYPSIFRLISQQLNDFSLASICNWNPINIGIIEEINTIKKSTASSDRDITNDVVKYIRESNNGLLFVHLDEMDGAGHKHDYFTEGFMDELPRIDSYVGEILLAIEESGKMDESLIFLVSDHGGGAKPKSHGENHIKDMGIFIIAHGHSFEAIEKNDEVSIMDITPTILQYLGLAVPSHMEGKILS